MSPDPLAVVTLQLSPALWAIVAESGDPPDLFFRKMFALYVMARQAKREGKAVGAATSADVLETEFVGI